MDADMIDRDAAMPVWMQVRDILRHQIEDGTRSGHLAGERALAGEFDVVPGTIRKALRDLRQAGLLVTYAGRGTWVVPPEERPGQQ